MANDKTQVIEVPEVVAEINDMPEVTDLAEAEPSETVTELPFHDEELEGNGNVKKTRTMMYVNSLSNIRQRFPNYNDGLRAHLEKHFKDAEWAFIVHDKDMIPDEDGFPSDFPAGDHVHISFNFSTARSLKSVAKIMGDTGDVLKSAQNVKVFKGRNAKGSLFSYLIHLTAKAKAMGKYQYPVSEVHANFDYEAFVKRTTMQVEASTIDVDEIASKIISGELVKRDLYVNGPYGNSKMMTMFYTKHERRLDTAIKHAYVRRIATAEEEGEDGGEGEVPVEVIYIQGEAGSGKSKLAKSYAKKRFGHYFVSGSSNDSVQEYMGEKVAIFDDARPTDFPAHEWLKMLDPYGKGASVRSRYYNKFLAVECIIITTTTPFEEFWFHTADTTVEEPIDQFFRRFAGVIKVTSAMMPDGSMELTGNVHEVIPVPTYPLSARVGNKIKVMEASYKMDPVPMGKIREVVKPVSKRASLNNILDAFN